MRVSLKPPNRKLQTELETPRFILRPVGQLELVPDPGGWRSLQRIYGDIYLRKEPMSFSTWLKMGPFPDGQRRFTFAIVPKGSDRAVGYHMVRLSGLRTASNTVGIHDDAWLGKDVAVEARARLMNHFFRHGIERFSSRCHAGNLPSIFTYRKLGYAHVGTLHREHAHPGTGQPVDVLLFEMLKENWMRSPYAEPDL
ncbi:MAG: N-acetyltransferase [Alphaproteobacteria bacterium]|nr:MAG: N-acetyltransferase [Alphaproteobacteria bacterium]